jgi:hypothetical protein
VSPQFDQRTARTPNLGWERNGFAKGALMQNAISEEVLLRSDVPGLCPHCAKDFALEEPDNFAGWVSHYVSHGYAVVNTWMETVRGESTEFVSLKLITSA